MICFCQLSVHISADKHMSETKNNSALLLYFKLKQLDAN